jgi:hypothetical protein
VTSDIPGEAAASATPAPRRPEPDARAVAAAARGCVGVLDLAGGAPVKVATYLPGERVLGVRVGPGWAEVHLVGEYGVNLAETAVRVREAVQRAARDPAGDVAVDIVFEDVLKCEEVPASQDVAAPAPGSEATERSST